MKRIILIIFFLSFFFFENLSAQSKYGFSLGGGYISYALDKTKLPYWENGYLINFTSNYKLAESISLFLSSSFQQHYFNSKLVTLIVTEEAGYRYSISGENSSVIELSIGSKLYGSKFYISKKEIRSYLGIGTGLLLINQGNVFITEWMEGISNKITRPYSYSNKNYSVAQINFSLGLEVEITASFHLVLDGELIACFDGPIYFPLSTSIKYDL